MYAQKTSESINIMSEKQNHINIIQLDQLLDDCKYKQEIAQVLNVKYLCLLLISKIFYSSSLDQTLCRL